MSEPTRERVIQWAADCGDDVEHTLPSDLEFLERFAVAAREDLARTWLSPDAYNVLMEERAETLKELSAAQAENVRLREVIGKWDRSETPEEIQLAEAGLIKCLSQPTDTSALEAMITKSAETMRERCLEVVGPIGNPWHPTEYEDGCNATKGDIDNEIRALPGVTMEDVK